MDKRRRTAKKVITLQTAMNKKVDIFSGKHKGDTVSCRPG